MVQTRADYNLVVPLRALLDLRSVSGAARELGVSQPTMSHLLQQLRRHFADPLLVRTGNTYELTPLAVRLRDLSIPAARSLDGLFAADSGFNQLLSTRRFRVVASDSVAAVLGSVLSSTMNAAAPNVSVRFDPPSSQLSEDPAEYLRGVDGALVPFGVLQDPHRIEVMRDSWVCVAWTGNPLIGAVLEERHLRALPWVSSYGGTNSYNVPMRQMETHGISARIEVEIPSFLAVPRMVVGTDRLAFLPAAVARSLDATAGIRVLDCPIPVPPLTQGFWWHPIYDDDPEHVWLRGLADRIAAV